MHVEFGFVRVAAASPRLKVANPAFNAEQTVRAMQQAYEQGVQLILFPELGLTGYTCGELFLQDRLLADADRDFITRKIRQFQNRISKKLGSGRRQRDQIVANMMKRHKSDTVSYWLQIIMSLGIPVVAMGMIGLVSAMTSNILERTREIGILRSIGARARHIRRVFLAEAVALVVAGWLLGIAVGYVIARIVLRAMNDAFDVSFTLRYPAWPMLVALVLTLVVAAAVLRRPLRRAGRLSPSTALRYE